MGKRLAAVALGMLIGAAVAGRDAPSPRPAAQFRRPVAAGFLAGGRVLCVANSRGGTVSLVNVDRSRVDAEVAVGGRLTDLAVVPGGQYALVTDDERHELIALAFDGGRLAVRARLAVAPYPASVA